MVLVESLGFVFVTEFFALLVLVVEILIHPGDSLDLCSLDLLLVHFVGDHVVGQVFLF